MLEGKGKNVLGDRVREERHNGTALLARVPAPILLEQLHNTWPLLCCLYPAFRSHEAQKEMEQLPPGSCLLPFHWELAADQFPMSSPCLNRGKCQRVRCLSLTGREGWWIAAMPDRFPVLVWQLNCTYYLLHCRKISIYKRRKAKQNKSKAKTIPNFHHVNL